MKTRRTEVPTELRGEPCAELLEVLLEPDHVDAREASLAASSRSGVNSTWRQRTVGHLVDRAATAS